jgi:hypothetical protein
MGSNSPRLARASRYCRHAVAMGNGCYGCGPPGIRTLPGLAGPTCRRTRGPGGRTRPARTAHDRCPRSMEEPASLRSGQLDAGMSWAAYRARRPSKGHARRRTPRVAWRAGRRSKVVVARFFASAPPPQHAGCDARRDSNRIHRSRRQSMTTVHEPRDRDRCNEPAGERHELPHRQATARRRRSLPHSIAGRSARHGKLWPRRSGSSHRSRVRPGGSRCARSGPRPQRPTTRPPAHSELSGTAKRIMT